MKNPFSFQVCAVQVHWFQLTSEHYARYSQHMKYVTASYVSKCYLNWKPGPGCQPPWQRLLFPWQNSVKEDCPAWLGMARMGASHQADFLLISPIFPASLSSLCFLPCNQMYTHNVMGYVFLVYPPAFKSMQQNHFDGFCPCDLPWHVYDDKMREQYKSWHRAPERMSAPPT